VTGSRHAIPARIAGSPHRGRSCPPGNRAGDRPTSAVVRSSLDRVLELVELRQLSATELRLLLRLVDREASLSELGEQFGGQRPAEIRRAGRSLAMRGLVQWRHVGRRKETRLGITASGLATMRALLTAAGHGAGEAEPSKASIP
jgi:predicted transcriptional regulator